MKYVLALAVTTFVAFGANATENVAAQDNPTNSNYWDSCKSTPEGTECVQCWENDFYQMTVCRIAILPNESYMKPKSRTVAR